jgi:hypothetical protein
MEMSGREVQAIQKRLTGMATEPPSIEYQSLNSGAILSRPFSSILAISCLAQEYIRGTRAREVKRPMMIPRKQRPVIPSEVPWISAKM